MTRYEFTPDEVTNPIFTIAVDTEERKVKTDWHYDVNRYIERVKGDNNSKNLQESHRILQELKYFWKNVCQFEYKTLAREWVIKEVLSFIKERDEELFSFLKSE